MKPLREILRDADPVAHEPALPSSDVDRMRRTLLAERPIAGASWTRPALLAAAALAIVVAALADRSPARSQDVTGPTATPNDTATRRQLQFVTPGGTRVIWTFDSTFDMR